MKAFLAALLLFAVTVAGCHIYIQGRIAVDNPGFSTWPEETKGKSLAGLQENMNEGSFPVFGSSEFQHGTETIYHPASIFSESRFNPMLIGAGYYQSLGHAITLSALEGSMEQRKAVLILSPQWFRKTGVVDQAYASRFSETLYAGMLANEKLSDETKNYISERTHKLLQGVDAKTLEHVTLHEKVLWKKNGNGLENAQEELWNRFLHEKELFSMSTLQNVAGIRRGNGLPEEEQEPDWDALLQQAQADGEQENQNEFFIDDSSYKLLEPYLNTKKDMNKDAVNGYQKSPEYDDLRCFLQVCRELEITPMLVLIPVNGYYYDFTGFPKTAREGYYEKIRAVAKEYDVQIADFSDQEYTKYFFEDRVHIGKKGWVMVCESLYQFYQEN
ncbi:MAG: D-alanyl-lipoteichoic acid biosynthesis protein DltD [Lachnospiraceae bacterium]|nr:D-alanyl-lipoteichoic acid biosynthesis protein DltD [Lachnospiraceae bacterium]